MEEGPRGAFAGVSRTMLRISIGCLSLAALIAILALLSGDYGDTEARISLTVLAVAGYNVLALAGVALHPDRRAGWVGTVCVAVAAIAFVLAVVAIWTDPVDSDDDALLHGWGVATVLAISLGQASLLLARRRRGDGPAVRTVIAATLAAIAAVATLVTIAILGEEEPSEAYWRILGAIAVLDILGMLLTPILRRLQATDRPTPPPPGPSAPSFAAELGLERAAISRGDSFVVPRGELAACVDAATREGARLLVPPTELPDGGALAVLAAADGSPLALIESSGSRSSERGGGGATGDPPAAEDPHRRSPPPGV